MTEPAELNQTHQEVLRNLHRAVDEGFPECYADEKRAASRALINEFLRLADKTGLEHQSMNGYVLFGKTGLRFIRIGIDNHTSAPWVSHHENLKLVELPLAFDVLANQWVGTEIDHGIAAAPGTRLPRKDALIVLAETISSMLKGSLS